MQIRRKVKGRKRKRTKRRKRRKRETAMETRMRMRVRRMRKVKKRMDETTHRVERDHQSQKMMMIKIRFTTMANKVADTKHTVSQGI
jgi:hypothetical protein